MSVEQWSRVRIRTYDYQFRFTGDLWGFEKLEATRSWNGPGKLQVELPSDHPMIPTMLEPGSNAQVYLDGELFWSGRFTDPEGETDPLSGTTTVPGESWMALLDWTLGYPVPGSPLSNQSATPWWQFSGPAESLVKKMVADNFTVRGLWPEVAVEATQGRGVTMQAAVRFQPIADRARVAMDLSGLAWFLDHTAPGTAKPLTFTARPTRTFPVLLNRFAVMQDGNWKLTAPQATHAIVGGRGAGVQRVFREATSTDHPRWRREAFVDANDLEVSDTMTAAQSDQAALDKAGETLKTAMATSSLDVELAGVPSFEWMNPYDVGDIVTMEVGAGLRIMDWIVSVDLRVDPDSGIIVSPKTGGWEKARNRNVRDAVQAAVSGIKAIKAGR